MRLLVKAGTRLDGGGPWDPPLKEAVGADNIEMVRLLISLGADVNGRGAGAGPLFFALLMNRLAIARVLIEAGADVKAERAEAEQRGMKHIVSALDKALGPPAPPMPVEKVVACLEARFDAHSLGEQLTVSDYPTDEELEAAQKELAARMKAKPQDARTLLLWAKLWMLGGPKVREASLSGREALDRLLAADPRNSEALYFQGRMLGGPCQGGKRCNLGEAIPLLRKAVEAAPKNVKYREVLALFLADEGRPGEARRVLSAGAKKNHPMLMVLEDWEKLSVPDGTEFFFEHMISFFGVMSLDQVGLQDHQRLRVRTFLLQKSRSEIENFYAARVPGFHFFAEGERKPEGSEEPDAVTYVQFLRPAAANLRPSSNRKGIPHNPTAGSGILMVLIEMKAELETQRKLGPDEHRCFVILVNFRK